VSPAQVLKHRDEGVRFVEQANGGAKHLHELAPLFLKAGRKEPAQPGIEFEESLIEKGRGSF
jgi:hypothetical protein